VDDAGEDDAEQDHAAADPQRQPHFRETHVVDAAWSVPRRNIAQRRRF
jgi:hypothetical protein